MAFMGRQIKLGTYDTAGAAFVRYKEYKEDFIKDMAEQYIRIAFGIIVNVLKNKLIVFLRSFVDYGEQEIL